ncbi:SDR family NAD(P)-dependent oxidoreductase [Dactylosporangium sucinum]|uniref:Uncharacterized protein n=1 Tax=Dactylosporangium sucinum TaxID=1424081 RepID=A0A917TTE3_9ACTN|nr:SDR family NAD(P)-dependent oxidoreductase [Dactylosporangium sucinum]GGM36584.1 hypothetical protein GCM10007977_042590 [Dactylosporangium sucinum]
MSVQQAIGTITETLGPVSVGSQAGLVGIEERAAYCASKAALLGLTRAMAIEL